jgi:hypothetical protein
VTAPLQLTITSGAAPAMQPGTGVDPDGSSEPVEAAFGTGAGGSTAVDPGQPGAELDLPPVWITFGPGPTPTPTSRPASGGRTPQPGTGIGTSDGGSTNPGRIRRSARTVAGRRPTSGLSTGPRPGRRPSRLGRIPAVSPMRASRPGRVAGGGSLPGGLGSLLGWLGSALAGLQRSGQGRASQLTPEDWRVIGILAVALIVALGGQVDRDAPANGAELAASSAGPAAGGQVASTPRVLDLARAEIGTVEGRGGATPYHQAYGLPSREPWCAVFVRTMFERASGAASIGPKTAYTPTMAGWFRERGQWTAEPVVGALVFYDFPDSKRRIQHVGIVESFTASTITAIEGNTASGAAGSQDDGDGVWRRTRPRNGSIVGYGLPAYSLNHQHP